MNLDDLKAQWEACDRRIQESIRLERRRLRASLERGARGPLQWLALGIWVELAVCAVAVIVLGNFIADHITELRFAAPAVMLDLAAIALLVFAAHQLIAIRRLDFASPVVALQKELARLRVLRIQATRWTIIVAPLLWTPLLIVGLRALRVDGYAVLHRPWLIGNALFGLLAIPLLLWASRRLARRFEHAGWFRGLMDDVAGRSLREASLSLADLAELESGGDAGTTSA